MNSTEFQLAVECCRWTFTGAGEERIQQLCAEADWAKLLRIVQYHRVEGLAWRALSKHADHMPGEVRDALSAAARAVAVNNLRAAVASQQLLDCFEAERVPLLFLKGLTIGALAYGNSALKMAIDIDLLIDPPDLGKAAELLRRWGYGLAAPRASPGDRILRTWHRTWKESVWTKATPVLQIDLHTRVADNRRLLPSITVHAPRQVVEVGGGIHLPTLADDELFAYLSVHGASSAWFRLKWVADLAGFISGKPNADIDRLYRRSQELAAGRAPGQALLVAHTLFGSLAGHPDLLGRLRNDPAIFRLSRIALSLIHRTPGEPTERFLGTLPIHLSQLAIQPGAAYKLSHVGQQVHQFLTRALL